MPHDEPLDVETVFTCWCGETGAYADMCDDALDGSCAGTGSLNCYCGGDFCVCHNHGEVECDGCEDCDPGDEDDGFDERDYEEDDDARG